MKYPLLDDLRWHNIHTNNLRGSGVGITNGRDYEVSCSEYLGWHDNHMTFTTTSSWIQVTL
jgi:hypothetical protein